VVVGSDAEDEEGLARGKERTRSESRLR